MKDLLDMYFEIFKCKFEILLYIIRLIFPHY